MQAALVLLFFLLFLLLFVLFFLLKHIGLCTARTAAKHSLVYALLEQCSDSHFQHRGGRRPPGCKAGDGSSRLPVAFSSSDDEAKPKGFFLQSGLKSCRLCVPFAPLWGRPLWCLLQLEVQEPKTCCGSSLQSIRPRGWERGALCVRLCPDPKTLRQARGVG